MPVEIRELIIRAETNLRTPPPETVNQPAASPPNQEDANYREAIIQECVRQVLRILQKQKER